MLGWRSAPGKKNIWVDSELARSAGYSMGTTLERQINAAATRLLCRPRAPKSQASVWAILLLSCACIPES